MVNRVVIGDKLKMQAKREDISECLRFIDNLADKSVTELKTWFDQRFSGFTQAQQDGLWILAKAQWATARCMKKMIKTVENTI